VETTVGVVDLEVGYFGAVNLHMDGVLWHSVGVGTEDSGLIHIVPERVQVVGSLEGIVTEETAPVVLSVHVQEVNPCGVAGPAVAVERSNIGTTLTDEDVRDVSCRLLLVLQIHTLGVDEVVLASLDMGVDNHYDAAALIVDLLIHLGDLGVGEVLGVEFEVFVASRVVVLLRPLNVGPQNVNWEAVFSKLTVPVHQHLGGDRGPLAEVVAQGVKEGHGSES